MFLNTHTQIQIMFEIDFGFVFTNRGLSKKIYQIRENKMDNSKKKLNISYVWQAYPIHEQIRVQISMGD